MKNLKRISSTITLSLSLFLANAQYVSTFSSPPSNGDVAIDKDGYVYVSSENNYIYQLATDGSQIGAPYIRAGSLDHTKGMVFNATGDTLYVVCSDMHGDGWISKIDPSAGDTKYATGLDMPEDVAIDSQGNLFVTEYNNKIQKIDKDGNVSLFVQSALFNHPFGIVCAQDNIFFVGSSVDGNIYKVTHDSTGVNVSLHANVNGPNKQYGSGHLIYWKGNLYVTNGSHYIYKVDLSGNVSKFTGSGRAKLTNGSIKDAEFESPMGIDIDHDGNKIYISEYGKSRVRLILGGPVISGVQRDASFNSKASIYPNPLVYNSILEIKNMSNETVSVQIIDVSGKVIADVFNGKSNNDRISIGMGQFLKDLSSDQIYLCKIQSQKSSEIIKIFKSKG